MKKTVLIVAAGLLAMAGLKAQNLQEGINHLYADRFKSAAGVFEKLIAANPNNTEAIYWLGQTYLDEDLNDKARDLYDKALASSNNAPLIVVGRGHVDLLDGKTNEARQKFESAITATNTKKGDDPNILNAVGRANVDAKLGDLPYAVQKLQAAVQRDSKNPDIFLNLGNAHRKARPGEGGGEAFTNYNRAIEVNPNFAVAYVRLAKLFETQRTNSELYLENLNKAVAVDPKFTAAYYELFYYYFYRQKFDDAEGFLKKYIDSKLPETDSQDEFLYAQLCWARKDFNCAITKAEGVVRVNGEQTKARVYKLLADSYNQKNDSVNAKKYIDQYFAKEKPENYIGFDYSLKAEVYSRFPGLEQEAFNAVMEGVRIDTVPENKVEILTKWADRFKAKAQRDKEGDLLAKVIEVKARPNINDYFYASRTYYFARQYDKSRAYALQMVEKYPDEIFGYEWAFNSSAQIDTVKKDSIAVPDALKLYDASQKDTVKFKKHIINTTRFLAGYYNNEAKDKDKALEYLRKWQQADTANATTIQGYIDALQKAAATRPPASPKGNSKPGGQGPTPQPKPGTSSAKAEKR